VRVVSRGFTLVEVLVATVVLVTGILALAGSAALTSRMVGRGWLSTRVALSAADRVDRLRRVAYSTAPACTAPEWRDDSAGVPGLAANWQVLDVGGPARMVRVVVRSRHPSGVSADTVLAGMLCESP
jgi:prepilin-type N-terminal cleavage/methylation domain-containing protein